MEIEDRKRIYDALLLILSFLTVCWGLFLLEGEFDIHFKRWGNRPRTSEGLIGILTSPLLHSDLKHIWGNTVSFFSLTTFLVFFYRPIAFKVFGLIYILSGVLLWIWGGPGNHIGASGVIYGIAAFVFFGGLLRNDTKLLRVSLAVAFLYGSLIWWVLPIDPHISWEGHLSGAVIGVALAWLMRTAGPQAPIYQWEIDELEEQRRIDHPEEFEDPATDSGIKITYEYIEKPKEYEQKSP